MAGYGEGHPFATVRAVRSVVSARTEGDASDVAAIGIHAAASASGRGGPVSTEHVRSAEVGPSEKVARCE